MIEEEQVLEILEKVRPQLQMDGGDVEFVGIDGNIVQIRLQGHCGCMMSQMTLKMGIERILRQEIPEIGNRRECRLGVPLLTLLLPFPTNSNIWKGNCAIFFKKKNILMV